MAKMSRKKAVKKPARKAKAKAKPKAKAKAKAKPKSSRKVKIKSPDLGARLSSAYHTVVDTMKGTGTLRDRMAKPGDSETE